MALQLDPMPVVWGITGNLGGGKSLTAVCLAAVAMARGYFVVSNISLNLDELAAEYGQHVRRLYQHFSFEEEGFDPFALPTGSPRGTRGGKRVLVIMDECAEWIDQYSSVTANPRIKRFLSWLRHSSKRSQDVILVVQRLDYLNKNIRLLISKWVIVDDLRVWRMPVVKMRMPFMGGFVMQRVFDRNKKLIQGPCIVNKASFGRFYNTAECLNSSGAAINNEYGVPILNNYPFIGWIFAYLLSLLLLASVLGSLARSWSVIDARPPMEVLQHGHARRNGPSGGKAHAVRVPGAADVAARTRCDAETRGARPAARPVGPAAGRAGRVVAIAHDLAALPASYLV